MSDRYRNVTFSCMWNLYTLRKVANTVNIRYMMLLSEKHPDILTQFQACRVVVHKTSHKFSAMVFDQCHEQNNAIIKGSGGANGFIINPEALRRWVIAGPEVARMIIEFEEFAVRVHRRDTKHLHHEQHFLKGVTISLYSTPGSSSTIMLQKQFVNWRLWAKHSI